MNLIDRLKKERLSRNNYNTDIQKKIIEGVVKNIEIVNLSGITRFRYRVPSFIVGYPVYEYNDMVSKVTKKLKKMGFSVIIDKDYLLLISW